MKEQYLYLIWKDPISRRNFTVGKLSKSDKYTFNYLPEAEDAKATGWDYLKSFPADETYESKTLFSAFSSRLPDPKRPDIAEVLKKYGMEKFDEFELLKRSGARLPIDTYELIDPIFPEDKTVQRDFYVMGIRHNALCAGNNCDNLPQVEVGDTLRFVPEPDNSVDPFAILVETCDGNTLGYVPRYYNREILVRLDDGSTYSCVVTEVNKTAVCTECIKVRLNMPSKPE